MQQRKSRVWPFYAALLLICPVALSADEPASPLTTASPGTAAVDGAIELFEKQIRPILVNRCQKCHSGEDPKGSLSLETRAGLLTGGDSGPAIVPGNIADSLLVDAVNYGDSFQMPPKSKLPDVEIAALTKWVELGAPWPDQKIAGASKRVFDLQKRKDEHWAWQPIGGLTVPNVRDTGWPRSPIDQFILAKLEMQGLRPAPAADRRTLARRLYFDLIGLPPTPDEMAEFLSDESPLAVERLVDRLLASPHFGERWARHWLDLVRYAETRGHEFDYQIPGAFEYRDYVVRALNVDVPYDQFVTEHIAGDLLEHPRLHPTHGFNESILATGFWFFGEGVHSPVDLKQDEADRVDNMIDVFGKAFQGLTIGCARCHDHKFDAISTKDYYALSGFIRSSGYRRVAFDTMEHNRTACERLGKLDDERSREVHKILADMLRPTAAEQIKSALQSSGDQAFAGVSPVPQLPEGAEVILDFSALKAGDYRQDGFNFGARPLAPGDVATTGDDLSKLRLSEHSAAVKDSTWDVERYAPGTENDPCRLEGWSRAGRTFRTRTFTVGSGKLYYLVRGKGYAHVPLQLHWLNNGPLHAALIKQFDTGDQLDWVEHDLSTYPNHVGHIEFTALAGAPLEVQLVVQSPASPTLLAGNEAAITLFGIDVAASPESTAAVLYERLQSAIAKLAGKPSTDVMSPGDAAVVNWAIANSSALGVELSSKAGLAELKRSFAARRAEIAAQIKPESRLAVAIWEGSGTDESVMIRGSSQNRGDVVPRRFLEAISGERPITSQGSGRLQLAQELLRDDNPFTARVMVNRIWHHLFGRGIVPTVDNFGVLGQPPTHPELLDWLADDFRRDGWSIKRTIKQIVISQTYQMSSQGEPTGDQSDPENLLWHRRQLKRLEGEAIRDAILSVSGRLDRTMFGPAVEVHLTPFLTGRGMPASGPLDGAGRRSIYQKVRRNFLSPMMLAFDTPMPIGCIGRRAVSNVPAQALILMNDPFVVTESRRWAEKVLIEEPSNTTARLNRLYKEAFGRAPTDTEAREAETFLQSQATLLGKSADDPAAWADLCQVLLNAKEFIFIQ